MTKAVFFDRDNTLIVADDYLGDPEGVVLMDGAAACLADLRRAGWLIVTVSNQSGVARGKFTIGDVARVDARMDELLLNDNPAASIDLHLFCPHHPELTGDCDCRKPKPGMFFQAAAALEVELSQSWLVGDAPRDVEAGAAAGCRTILLDVPGLARSPAADADLRVPPTQRAASLAAVTETILRAD